MTTDLPHALVIERLFAAPRDAVFRAWTDPRRVRGWWSPRGFTTLSCDLDLRRGGGWRVSMRSPSGGIHAERGLYREIAEPERLVFSQAWEDPNGDPGPETLVTVTFAIHGATTTKLTFQQTGFATLASRDEHEEGWSSCFDLLAEELADPQRDGRGARTVEEGRVRALLEGWAQALRERNLAGVVTHYASDAVVFDLAPPLTHQGAEIAKNLAAWFPTWKGPIGLELRDLRVFVGDDVAFSTILQRIHGERTHGETSDVWVRATHGFRKDAGVWVIANEHLSVPFYMDGSEKAATDLKP